MIIFYNNNNNSMLGNEQGEQNKYDRERKRRKN